MVRKFSEIEEISRLKVGCGQNWPPHNLFDWRNWGSMPQVPFLSRNGEEVFRHFVGLVDWGH
jgi:hypothetical protein